MPQLVLPLFSPECKLINNHIGFEKIGSRIYYFHGRLPVLGAFPNFCKSIILVPKFLIGNTIVKEAHASCYEKRSF